MLISSKKEDDLNINNLIRNKIFKLFFRKRLFLYTFFIFIFGTILTIPLDYGRDKSAFMDRTRKVLSISLGAINPKYRMINDEIYQYGGNLFGISKRFINASFNKVDEIKINLNFKNYQKLKLLRDKAMNEGILIRSKNDEASGYLTYKGKNYPIKIRLKGDWTDHLLGDKWSFRVKTKGNHALLGMENFSLQHPRIRKYINEFIFHKLLEYEKLPFLRYTFLPLYINDKYLGIYALEEHFGKNLLENSGYREGPILKFSDKDLRNNFQYISFNLKDNGLDGTKNFIDSDLNNAEIQTFNMNKLLKNDSIIDQYILARSLLDKFLRKELTASEVFDLDKTAKFYAISDLLQQLPVWYDIRFYYDPLKGRLVPIGYDLGSGIRTSNRKLAIDVNTLNIFDDEEFTKLYISNLEKLISPDYLDKFLISISKETNKELLNINKSYPHVRFLKNELKKNKKYIETRLNTKEPIYISKYSNFNVEKPNLKIFNKTFFPIEIIELSYKNKTFIPNFENTLKGRDKFKRVNSNNYKFKTIEVTNKEAEKFSENLIISYRYKGGSKIFTFTTRLLPQHDATSYKNPLINRNNNLDDFPSLIVNKKEKVITLKNDLEIKKPLIIPKGYKLIINQGLRINLTDQGMIFLSGPLVINGKSNNPVVFKSTKGGKGIIVVDSSETSQIKYSTFDNLNSPSQNSLNISGGITFYNSPVIIKNSKFTNSNAEDSLNIVGTFFEIIDSYFYSSKSDALDVDFSNGKIYNTYFQDIGNDAIDISGGEVFLRNISVDIAGDKAISSGEKSEVIIDKLKVSNAFIGIASKDNSKVKLNRIKINDVKYCLAAYQKKPEYGPGLIEYNGDNSYCRVNFLLEKGSLIDSDDYRFIPNIDNAFSKLYEEVS